MILPHFSKLSGTSAALLAEQHTDSLAALDALFDKMHATEFNSRDYSPSSFTAATAEREVALRKLNDVREYLLAHLDGALDA
jgi:hypothetical protein